LYCTSSEIEKRIAWKLQPNEKENGARVNEQFQGETLTQQEDHLLRQGKLQKTLSSLLSI